MLLEQFNTAPAEKARDLLKPCLDVPRWIEEITSARPFASLDDLLDTARSAADPFTPEELEGALAHHPRIGEKAAGRSTEASMSRSEQSGVDQRDEILHGMERATTREEAHAAAHRFLRWLEKLELVT